MLAIMSRRCKARRSDLCLSSLRQPDDRLPVMFAAACAHRPLPIVNAHTLTLQAVMETPGLVPANIPPIFKECIATCR